MKLQREPTTPGEILSEEFLKPLAMTQANLAGHRGCAVKVVNRQQAVDIYHATRKMKKVPDRIPLAG